MARKPRKAHRKPRTAKAANPPAVVLALLGEAVELVYRRADGKVYSHKFKRGVRIGATPDNKALCLSPLSVGPFIE